MSVNKVLWAHRHTVCYCCLLFRVFCSKTDLRSSQSDLVAGKASRVYHLTLYRKKCWPLAFVHRFLVVFLLSLENGELLLAVRGRGMTDFGMFLLKLSPFGVCGLAESASEGRSVYQVVLEIQNPFFSIGQHPLPRPPLQAQGCWCPSLFQGPGDCIVLWFPPHSAPVL